MIAGIFPGPVLPHLTRFNDSGNSTRVLCPTRTGCFQNKWCSSSRFASDFWGSQFPIIKTNWKQSWNAIFLGPTCGLRSQKVISLWTVKQLGCFCVYLAPTGILLPCFVSRDYSIYHNPS